MTLKEEDSDSDDSVLDLTDRPNNPEIVLVSKNEIVRYFSLFSHHYTTRIYCDLQFTRCMRWFSEEILLHCSYQPLTQCTDGRQQEGKDGHGTERNWYRFIHKISQFTSLHTVGLWKYPRYNRLELTKDFFRKAHTIMGW